MACPRCGCKETNHYDDEDAPDDCLERCAACGVIFDIEDHADEEDYDIHPAISLLDAIQDRPIEPGAALIDKCVKLPPNAPANAPARTGD